MPSMALQPPADLPLSESTPLKAASDRLHRAKRPMKLPPPNIPVKRGRRPTIVSPDLVIGMKAAGVPQNRMAEALGCTPNTITATLNREPDSRERIADLRDKLKGIKMVKAHQLEGKMWDRLEKEVDTGDAKDVDAMARALLASEKIQAAASGEAHASGAVPPPSNQDLAGLIQVLINAPGG